MKKVAVIGSGPAGLMAALFAAQGGGQVTIIDTNEHTGRKLLVTGAGRCNLTNADVAAVRYACDNPVWLNEVLLQFSREDLLHYLDSIGIPTFATFDGWYYPVSESAHAVADAFDAALISLGVEKMLRKQVTGVQPTSNGLNVLLHRDALSFDRVVIACGGKAYPAMGSDGSLHGIIHGLGHKFHPVNPALAPITADMQGMQALQGIRLDADVTLKQAGTALGKTFGNIIFTRWGVNGPGVMDLSYLVHAYSPKNMLLQLNFLHRHEAWLRYALHNEAGLNLPARVLVQSILPPKLASFMLSLVNIPADTPRSKLSAGQVSSLMEQLTNFQLTVTGTRGFEYCQVSSGGVAVEEVHPETMESLIVPGLYFAGEVLDVVGPCGGYNLHFAFTTGAIAGQGAAG